MNANEVIANRALEILGAEPGDDVQVSGRLGAREIVCGAVDED
ncbi:hypothetical protein ACTWPT_50065 [Nonomuraea sp. 3N208]